MLMPRPAQQPQPIAQTGAGYGGAPEEPSQTEMGQQNAGTNFISQEDQTDPREKAYETAFKDTAYNIFSARYPTMVPSIVTFKVIKSSIVDGDAVGSFIMNHNGQTVYVPVVMSDNQTKPMDLMYSKSMDKFLPFSEDWLQIISAGGDQEMGDGVQVPPTLPADKDISRLIYPPLQGRVSYAMDLGDLNHLDLIKEASNDTKDLYKHILHDHPEFVKFAFATYPQIDIQDSLHHHQEKVASVPVKVETASLDDPSMVIKEVSKGDTKKAMADIAKDGFAFKDERPYLSSVHSTTESKIELEEPSVSGVYTLYKCDGSTHTAVVIVNPEGGKYGKLEGSTERGGSDKGRAGSVYGDWENRGRPDNPQYMIIHADGTYCTTHKIIASPSNPSEFKGRMSDLIFGGKNPGNLSGKRISFMKVESQIMAATYPREFDRVEMTEDGFKKFVVTTKDYKTGKDVEVRAVVNSVTPTGKVTSPSHGNLSFVPLTYKPVPLGASVNNDYLCNAEEVLTYTQRKMNHTGGRTVKLANIGAGEYTIDGIAHGTLKTASLELANTYLVQMGTAVTRFKKLSHFGDNEKILVMPHEKHASIFATSNTGSQVPPEMIQQEMGGQQPQPQPQPDMGQPQTGMMQVGAQTNDPDLYNLGVINSLSQQQDITQLLAVYSPTLEKALDNSGRMLLTFWVKGSEAKKELGENAYQSTEESLKTVFKELGSLLIKLNRRSAASATDIAMA